MSETQATITWTPEMLKRFKRAHIKAQAEGDNDSVFEFGGHEFVVGYAKHLIEFLDMKFNSKP